MSTVVVVNPRSAGGRTQRRWSQLREVVHEAHGAFETRFTESVGHGTALTREALAGGAKLVVALGGDGTINEVAGGFFAEDGTPLAPDATLAVLPAGTGGDFIRTLNIPRDFEAAARLLSGGPRRTIDVGRMTYTDEGGATKRRVFVNIASFGISGLVDRFVSRSSKTLGGKTSFMLATLKAGVAYKNLGVDLLLDGRPTRSGKIYNVAVSNGRYFGGGMMVAPNAVPDDGQFDVVIMGDLGLGDLLLHGLDIYKGTHLKLKQVTVERATRVEARPQDGAEVLLDVDGEQLGRLPATFELVPRALRVVHA